MITRAQYLIILGIVFCAFTSQAWQQSDYPIKPVPFTHVHFDDEFWAQRLQTNREVTIPYTFKKCEETGRIDNFLRAAGKLDGDFAGDFPFNDTDPYKILEGASYSLQVYPDSELEAYLDDLIAKFKDAQEEDGYLFTVRTIGKGNIQNWYGEERWERLRGSHELYNSGHMFEAAVAHYLSTGKRSFLDIAIKNADLLCEIFGEDKRRDIPGHQVIEMGLAKLYRVTGEEKYLNLAKFFLDERGHAHNRQLYGEYTQDHKPVVEQSEAVGHAVRATYMYAGMADIAALTGDQGYIDALDRIWNNVVSRKMHVTGGVGARGRGEAFGDNYELPNLSAYNETCAAIGHVFWNHRMFLLHGDAKYIDVMERTLYNGALSGVSMEGDRFFYPNPLATGPQGRERSPWFPCSCCPSNVTRFMPSIPGYAYGVRDNDLYVNLFVAGTAKVEMNNHVVELQHHTTYPWDGNIAIKVNSGSEANFRLRIRIPGWVRNQPVPSDLYRFQKKSGKKATLKINGKQVPIKLEKGYAVLERNWKKGDTIELNLPMPIRRLICHEAVENNRGKVALQRGPIVYCAEWVDNNGHIFDMMLPDDAKLKAIYQPDFLNGVTKITGEGLLLSYNDDGESTNKEKHNFAAIPYYAWSHRGPGEMTVWIAREEHAVQPLPHPSIASTGKISYSFKRDGGESQLSEKGINDQVEPKRSNDESIMRFHWWPHLGTKEWIQYEFEEVEKISMVKVYWFDDTDYGACRVPQSWRLLYRKNGEWLPVENKDEYGVTRDKYNTVTFEPIKTDALRLEVQLQPKFSAGILEWKVE